MMNNILIKNRIHNYLNVTAKNPFKLNLFRYLDEIGMVSQQDLTHYHITFVEVPKLGINPRTKYNTPLGIYTYNLGTKFYYKNVVQQRSVLKIPFANESNYIILCKETNSKNVVRASTYTKEMFSVDKQKLSGYLYSLGIAPIYLNDTKIYEFIENVYVNSMDPIDIKNFQIKIWTPFHRLMFYTYFCSDITHLSIMHAKYKGSIPDRSNIGKSDKENYKTTPYNTLALNTTKIFKNILSYSGIVDDKGTGCIHMNEPYQGVFFGKKELEEIEYFDNKATINQNNNNYNPNRLFMLKLPGDDGELKEKLIINDLFRKIDHIYMEYVESIIRPKIVNGLQLVIFDALNREFLMKHKFNNEALITRFLRFKGITKFLPIDNRYDEWYVRFKSLILKYAKDGVDSEISAVTYIKLEKFLDTRFFKAINLQLKNVEQISTPIIAKTILRHFDTFDHDNSTSCLRLIGDLFDNLYSKIDSLLEEPYKFILKGENAEYFFLNTINLCLESNIYLRNLFVTMVANSILKSDPFLIKNKIQFTKHLENTLDDVRTFKKSNFILFYQVQPKSMFWSPFRGIDNWIDDIINNIKDKDYFKDFRLKIT